MILLEQNGVLSLENEGGGIIVLHFSDDTSRISLTESGKTYIWDDKMDKEDE